MNEKQLAQIEEWLNGDRRYKLLDCEQTGILQLKGALLQVWLASYMCENDDQESWLGIKGLMRLTGLSNRAVIDARRDLVAMGALANTGHTANLKYANPTQGAYSVQIRRVDNPFKGEQTSLSDKSSRPSRKRREQNARAKSSLPSELCSQKVSVSVSAPVSLSGSKESNSLSSSVSKESDSLLSGSFDTRECPPDLPSLRETEKQKPKTKTKTLASAVRWAAKYDSPIPDGFNTWSQSARAVWVEAHRLKPGHVPAVLPVPETKGSDQLDAEMTPKSPALPAAKLPPNSAPPPTPADGRFRCVAPGCEYSSKSSTNTACHIEEQHPELGLFSFTIECPEHDAQDPAKSCVDRFYWNSLDPKKDKAQADAGLLKHLDVQHNQNSPNYNPNYWCNACVALYPAKDGHECKKKKATA
jgi:hypothetical protein